MFVHKCFCYVCKKETEFNNLKCSECAEKENNKKKIELDNTWKYLNTEEKLEYLRKKIENLEENMVYSYIEG